MKKDFRRGKPVIIATGTLMLAGVAFLDFITGHEYPSTVFYLLPVIYFGWFLGRLSSFLASAASAVLWMLSDILSGHIYSTEWIPYWNTLARFGTFLTVAYMLSRLQTELRLQREANERVRVASEEILRLANIKTEFCSMVSHELRTPLTAISESLNIVSDGSAGRINEQQQDFLETARRNVDRLARLIDEVLDFQKLESGKDVLTFSPCDINEVIREAVRGMVPLFRKKGLTHTIELEENLPSAEVDADRILQVLVNLLSNAASYSKKGKITVSSRLRGHEIIVGVKDEGPGIAKEDLDKLFVSFSQGSTARGRKTGGTGLGLAISKKLVEQHAGKIWVESSPGKGAHFMFTIPVE